MKQDYDKLSYNESKETNMILWINTVATIVTGIAAIILSVIALL